MKVRNVIFWKLDIYLMKNIKRNTINITGEQFYINQYLCFCGELQFWQNHSFVYFHVKNHLQLKD